MPSVPFSDAASDAVVTALNAAGLTYASAPVTFTRSRYPKYALKDIRTLKAHVVPVYPCRLDPHDDDGTAAETPIAITLDFAVEKNAAAVSDLTALLESIATFLAATDVTGLGYPVEALVVDRNEEMLDQGHFCGGVGVVYRQYRNGWEGE